MFKKKKVHSAVPLVYDYGSAAAREETVARLFALARRAREEQNGYWQRMRAYYDGCHDNTRQTDASYAQAGLPWRAAQAPDGFIHVETQIDATVPDFEFSAVEEADVPKAAQREAVVRSISERCGLELLNIRAERRLNVLGTACYKVGWDAQANDVCVEAPRPEQLFPDPSAAEVDACEYLAYVYRLHRVAALRAFAPDLQRMGIDPASLTAGYGSADTEFLTSHQDHDPDDETLQVTEWWFRQPCDGEQTVTAQDENGQPLRLQYRWKAGDIGLIVLLNGKEVRYVPRFWRQTGYRSYPFVLFGKVPEEGSLWGKSELEPIKDIIDAADRELSFAQLNAAFASNDIILAEENAFAEEGPPDNRPGAVWKLRAGMMGRVARLGNLAPHESALYANAQAWRAMMQETTGNFNVYQGSEPSRVTTATGIALLNERAKSRHEVKRAHKVEGFKRLYRLMDRMALENYDDGRVIRLGAATQGQLIYNARSLQNGEGYFPELDVRVNVGDGLKNSKSFTVSALSDLLRLPINADNFRLVQAFVELTDIPLRHEVNQWLEERFATPTPLPQGEATPL